MTAEADRNNPSIAIQTPGWALLPVAADLMPGGTPALLAALQEERLKAFLLIRPRPNRGRGDDDDGKRFEISTRYWTTDNARRAMQGGWVQAPVLELHPRDPTATVHHEVNKGGYVLLEEKAIRAHIAGEHANPQSKTDAEAAALTSGERVANADLFAETYWGIPHAFCWAATRDPEALGLYFAPAQGQAFRAAFPAGELTSLTLWMMERYSPLLANVESIEDAARLGRIEIEGKKYGRSSWRPIPAGDWGGGAYQGGLTLLGSDDMGGIYAADSFPHRKWWTHLRVKREDMLRAFRADEGHDRQGQAEVDVAAPVALERIEADKYVSAAEFYRQNEQSILRDLREAKQPHGIGVIRREAARRWNQMDGNESRRVKDDGSAFTKVKQRTKRSGA